MESTNNRSDQNQSKGREVDGDGGIATIATVHVYTEFGLVWDKQSCALLRQHRILGALIGSSADFVQQVSIGGLPMFLSESAVCLCRDKLSPNAVRLVDGQATRPSWSPDGALVEAWRSRIQAAANYDAEANRVLKHLNALHFRRLNEGKSARKKKKRQDTKEGGVSAKISDQSPVPNTAPPSPTSSSSKMQLSPASESRKRKSAESGVAVVADGQTAAGQEDEVTASALGPAITDAPVARAATWIGDDQDPSENPFYFKCPPMSHQQLHERLSSDVVVAAAAAPQPPTTATATTTSITSSSAPGSSPQQPSSMANHEARCSNECVESDLRRARRLAYADLWARGFWLSSGTKFGGDFLAYPGDPVAFHASHVVMVAQPTRAMQPFELVAFGRLGHSVKKCAVVAYVEPESEVVDYIVLDWSEHETLQLG